MNERIKKIAEDSGLYIAYENKNVTDKEIEYFAELLLREFVHACGEDRRYVLELFGFTE